MTALAAARITDAADQRRSASGRTQRPRRAGVRGIVRMTPPRPATLAAIRAAAAEAAAHAAIARALATHATPSEAAASLGCTLAALRRAAERADVPWPQRSVGRPRKAP